MTTPEQLLRKLDERFILGDITEQQYQQIRSRLQAQLEESSVGGARVEDGAAPSGDSASAPSHAGGMEISDSVIKGNVTSGSASVGNINIHVGKDSAGGSTAELEYEKCVMLTLRSGGSLESIRSELDDCRLSIGLPIRLAREIEVACLESCGRRPIQGRITSSPGAGPAPAGPDPLTRFFKSASESIASMFASPRHPQPGPQPNRPTPVPPARPSAARPGGGPPPVPRLALTPAAVPSAPTAADEAASVKQDLKDELRVGLKADLAEAEEKRDVAAGEGDEAVRPVNVEEESAPPRKPPPLPPMPPPLHWPMKGRPG